MVRCSTGSFFLASVLALHACGSGGGDGAKKEVTVSFGQAPSAEPSEGHSGSTTHSLSLLLGLGGVARLPEDLDVTLVIDAASTASEGIDFLLTTSQLTFPSGATSGSATARTRAPARPNPTCCG